MRGKIGGMRRMRRSFNSSERASLFLYSNGKCSICGSPLEKGWHADHMLPFSKGGATDVINGQALCPGCNTKKGDHIMLGEELWPWQKQAYRSWMNSAKDSFLCVACPGAGKTRFALKCASHFLQERNASVILVCNTEHLKKQWSDDAAEHYGINLDYEFENKDGIFAKDFHGACVHYSSVVNYPKIYRKLCSNKPTIVIIDEAHHAGTNLPWGDKIKEAFIPAKSKLLLSGTPIRSDNNFIPFVEYREVPVDGGLQYQAVPDFYFSYEDAQRLKICRKVFFPHYDGEMVWIDENFNKITCTFSDQVSERQANQRLNTAIDPRGDWVKTVCRAVDDRLEALRQYRHPSAGALYLAPDIESARLVASHLAEYNNDQDIVLVTSDDPASSNKIKAFKSSNQKWIIAIRMVSEGIDIPRLRIAVHGTNITTELFFRQAVGRIARMQTLLDTEDDQISWYYVPSDPRLAVLAEKIKTEILHVIETEDIEDKREEESKITRDAISPRGYFEPLSSTGHEDRIVSDSGPAYSASEMEIARAISNRMGLSIDKDTMIAEILRVSKDIVGYEEEYKPIPHKTNLVDQKKSLREKINRKVSAIAIRQNLDHDFIHNTLNSQLGVATQRQMEKPQLEEKLILAKKWLSTKEI